MSKQVKNATNR